MTTEPIEILVITFPQSRFDGSILLEVQKLVDADTVTIVDGLFVAKDSTGRTSLVELSDVDAFPGHGVLPFMAGRVDGLISAQDVEALTRTLTANSSAAVLAFEHTWSRPLQDAVAGAGGTVMDSVRMSRVVVEERRSWPRCRRMADAPAHAASALTL